MTTPILVQLRIGGFDLRQIQRQGNFAVYEQKQRGTVVAYEVIEIQQRPAETIMGRHYEAREGYPNNEQWGKSAWTCVTLDKAKERLAGLLEA